MSNVIDDLQAISRGAIIYFVGSLVALILATITKILIVKILTPYEFGVLSLALTILSIVSKLGGFGLPNGTTRQASYLIGKNRIREAELTITIGFCLILIFSLISFLILKYLVSILSIKIYKNINLLSVLNILSVAIIFIILSNFISTIFGVYRITKIKIYVSDVIPNIIRFVFILYIYLFIIYNKLFYISIIYLLSYSIAGFCSILLFLKKFKIYKNIKLSVFYNYSIFLLSFSIPLLLQSIMGLIMNWTDILLIGYYLSAKDVGIYNSASVLARFMLNILAAVNFLYLPVISSLSATNKIKDINFIYSTITKWLLIISTPLFIILFTMPKDVLLFLYGAKYTEAYIVLRLLVLAFYIHVIFGPNGMTLISLGEPKFTMYSTIIGAIVNLILNIILIPIFGINGAAVVTMITYIVTNLILQIKLYIRYKIYPFTINHIKILITSLFLIFILLNIKYNITYNIIFTIFIYFILLKILNCFDENDILIIRNILFKKKGY